MNKCWDFNGNPLYIDWLKIARCAQGYSAREIAETIEVRCRNYYLFEKGKKKLPNDKINKLIQTLGFPVHFYNRDVETKNIMKTTTFRLHRNITDKELENNKIKE